MENDWDLQAVPLASRSQISEIFPRRFSSNPVELLNPMKAVQTPLPALTSRLSENSYPSQKTNLCPQCSENFEKELAKLKSIEKSFSEAKQVATQPSLPQWLQNAKLNAADSKTADQSQDKDRKLVSEQKTKELQQKWMDTCLHLHLNFHKMSRADILSLPTLSMRSFNDPNSLARPISQPKLPTNKIPPSSSPVRTDLVLGRKGTDEKLSSDNQSKDFVGCISSEPQTKLLDKFAHALDADTYKNLLKWLMEKAWWQAEAASKVASAIARCRLGGGKRRSRGDIWLLFAGPDRAGKKKIASVLADEYFGASLITICLGARRDDDHESSLRGKTATDRIAEAVRTNPLSVIMLTGVDEAGAIVHGSIKRAIEVGKLTDSYGREVSIGNAIFIITGDWLTKNNNINHEVGRDYRVASGGWQLGLVVGEKCVKRRANWSQDGDDRSSRPRREAVPAGISFDLNLAVGRDNECSRTDGSRNSSDVTVDHEDELSINVRSIITSVPRDLLDSVDDSIVFKPFHSASVLREIKKRMSVKFATIVGDDEDSSLEVDDDVLEKILGGLLHDRMSLGEWIKRVLAPSFVKIKERITSNERSSFVVRLVVESDLETGQGSGDWLPSSILE